MSNNLFNYCNTFGDEKLPFPIPIDIAVAITPTTELLFSSADFYRTQSNDNVTLSIPLGIDISSGMVFMSPSSYLPVDIFNATRPITEITYPNAHDVCILTDNKFYHEVLFQYKITKSTGANYSNFREVRLTLVRADGTTPYDSSFFGNSQPNSGAHDTITISGYIVHNLNDLIRLNINVVQDNTNADQTDTKMTIFRISWRVIGLKS